jgi:hypothetical protein
MINDDARTQEKDARGDSPKAAPANSSPVQEGQADVGPRRPRGALTAKVCLLGAIVGGFFGSFAYPMGTCLGALGGLVAGVLWTRLMLRRTGPGQSRTRIVGAGVGWGVVVGLVATVILHGGIISYAFVVYGQGTREVHSDSTIEVYPAILLIAFACAVLGGTITGGLCGHWVADRHGVP